MKSNTLGRKILGCMATLLVAAAPLIYSSCGTGIVSPLDATSSQKSSTPAMTSVVPNSGPLDGGTVVTINGSNFTSDTQAAAPSVSFGGTPATNITVISSSQLKAQVPPHAAGSVGVQVTTSGGESASLANAFTYVTATFSLKSVSPISGPAAGGTTVTISGSDFQTGVSVTFGGLGATSVSRTNSSTLVAVTPVHSSASVTVTVTNPSGDSATLPSGFTYHSIDLLWSAPSTSTIAIAGYNVYRGNTSAGPFGLLNGSSPLATTSFIDATVEGGTTYYYEVKSVDTSGVESPPAGPVPATTTP
ncbi:MAG: IPT/TIG domain-containing protein [Terriglobia bacterium]